MSLLLGNSHIKGVKSMICTIYSEKILENIIHRCVANK